MVPFLWDDHPRVSAPCLHVMQVDIEKSFIAKSMYVGDMVCKFRAMLILGCGAVMVATSPSVRRRTRLLMVCCWC